ncbi:tartrate transporter [Moniliophthora roreri]|nr:tartrate transporter [Moniliophthora roreri]
MWTRAELSLGSQCVADDAGEADKDNESDSLLHGLKLALADPKVLIFAAMTMSQLLGLSFVNFFPTLAQTLGFNTTISLVLAAPPWLLGTVVCCLNAWHADRTGERFFHIAGWWWGVITGFIIALATMNTAARYISMIFMAFGYAGFSMTLVWVANTVPRPPAKRAAAIGIVNGTGNLGNLIGSFVWKAQWGPEYHQSMVISLCGLVLSSVLALTLRQMLVRENKRLDADELQGANRARVEEAAKLEGISFEEALERRKGFRYLY